MRWTALFLASSFLVAACDSAAPIRPLDVGQYRASYAGDIEREVRGGAGFVQVDICHSRCTPARISIVLDDSLAGVPLGLSVRGTLLQEDLSVPLVLNVGDGGVEPERWTDSTRGAYFQGVSGSMTLTRVDSSMMSGRFDVHLARRDGQEVSTPTLHVAGAFRATRREGF